MSTQTATYEADTERWWDTGDRWGAGTLTDRSGRKLTDADAVLKVAVTDGGGTQLLPETTMRYVGPGLWEQGPAPYSWFNGQRVVAVATVYALSDNRVLTRLHLILDPEPAP